MVMMVIISAMTPTAAAPKGNIPIVDVDAEVPNFIQNIMKLLKAATSEVDYTKENCYPPKSASHTWSPIIATMINYFTYCCEK